jgi:hypothetical protein
MMPSCIPHGLLHCDSAFTRHHDCMVRLGLYCLVCSTQGSKCGCLRTAHTCPWSLKFTFSHQPTATQAPVTNFHAMIAVHIGFTAVAIAATNQARGVHGIQNPGHMAATACMHASHKRAAVPMCTSFASQHHCHNAHIVGHTCTVNQEIIMQSKPTASASNMHGYFGSAQAAVN